MPDQPLRVRAIKQGFYADLGAMSPKLRQVGEVFEIARESHFAGPDKTPFQWMEWANEPTALNPDGTLG